MLIKSAPPLLIDRLAVEFVTPHGRVRALDDVSFQIGTAEIVGVVGESGSGKSVTAYSILGLTAGRGQGNVRIDYLSWSGHA